jgi:hypothetical protein
LPLSSFLESEMRNIMKERKILENKRLDLDACKNRVRKARAMQLQPPVRVTDIFLQLRRRVFHFPVFPFPWCGLTQKDAF